MRPDGNGLRALIEQDIMIGWGGCMAQARWIGDEHFEAEGCGDDVNRLVRLAEYVTHGSTQETEAFVEWLRVRAINALERWWYRVEAVAQALQERDVVTNREVKAIVAAADGEQFQDQIKGHPVFGHLTESGE